MIDPQILAAYAALIRAMREEDRAREAIEAQERLALAQQNTNNRRKR